MKAKEQSSNKQILINGCRAEKDGFLPTREKKIFCICCSFTLFKSQLDVDRWICNLHNYIIVVTIARRLFVFMKIRSRINSKFKQLLLKVHISQVGNKPGVNVV